MDQCRLLDWAYHEDWVQWFLQSITKGGPPGFGTIKLEKIVRADKKLWTLLAQRQTKSLRPSNDVPVLHESFKKLTTDPRVTLFVLPLPSSSRLVAAPEATPAPKNTAAPENNLQQEAVKKYTCVLRVKVSNICWSFNMSAGCSNSTSRTPAKCMRDFHVCAHCHKLGHSVTTCRSTPSSLQADQNSQERPFSGVSEVDDTPLQPQPTIFAES